MDWSNERYVRVYVRDTDDWLVLSWQARSLWLLIMRKLDRAGVLETKRGWRGVAAITGMPQDVVESALAELLADGCIKEHPSGYVAHNFIEAQETASSDQHRKRESRARRRDASQVTNRDHVGTDRDGSGTFRPANGTDGHARSQTVTDSHSEPSRADLSRAEPAETPGASLAPARAIPGAPDPAPTRVLDRLRQVRYDAWRYAGDRFRAVQADGISADQPDRWGDRPDMTGGDEQQRRANELVGELRSDFDAVLAAMKHVVDVRESEARVKRSLEWFTPTLLWGKTQFARAREMPATRRPPRAAEGPKVRKVYEIRDWWFWQDDQKPLTEEEVENHPDCQALIRQRGGA